MGSHHNSKRSIHSQYAVIVDLFLAWRVPALRELKRATTSVTTGKRRSPP